MIKFSGVLDLQGVKFPVFPLTLLVIVTTVLRYRAACDDVEHVYLRRNGGNTAIGSIVMTGNTSTNACNLASDHDVAIKSYVDRNISDTV